ncbi:LLM class flavin-dependent oxidoreductase [Actinoallomurus sp. NPDC052274]|uniref:LLM class flavin-dependent oxidoreductase n=1 Tax=Actinoallomurus sp. NPDC052274 TaxID=3155420 RepID=UPI00343E1041
MTRFHVVVPTRRRTPVVLPEFVTDPRPPGPQGEHHLVGRGAELAGWDGALVPFDPDGRDSLIVAAELLRDSRHIEVIAEFHPAIATPVYAAKLSASLQRYTGARLGWRLLVDLDPAVARAHGDFLEGPARYTRAEEFLTIAKGVWDRQGYTYEGEYFQVLDGGLPPSRTPRPFPRVYLSGTSAPALELSARHADVHVLGPEDDPALIPEGVAAAVRLTVPAQLAATDRAERELADEIRRHRDRGITEFLLDLAAPAEDTYRLGQRVLPLLEKEIEHAG